MALCVDQAFPFHHLAFASKTEHELNVINDSQDQQSNSQHHEGGAEVAWSSAAGNQVCVLQFLKKLKTRESEADQIQRSADNGHQCTICAQAGSLKGHPSTTGGELVRWVFGSRHTCSLVIHNRLFRSTHHSDLRPC